MRLFILLLALIAVPASAQEAWSTTDKVLAGAAITAAVIDWGQSRYIAKNPTLFQEDNPFLSQHPSVGNVNAYFLTGIVSAAAVTYLIPNEYRKYLLGGALVMEVSAVASNKRVGIRLAF